MSGQAIDVHEEMAITPAGFIGGYISRELPKFVQLGEGAQQGYFAFGAAGVFAEHRMKNLIVNRASVFMANRMRPGASWGSGINYLELGTGVGTGTKQAPEVENKSMVALRQPLVRKAITSWTYLDALGAPTAQETGTVQYTTVFTESEAVGSITEMALWGGDATAVLGSGYMFNAKAFPEWNKQDGMILTITWTVRW